MDPSLVQLITDLVMAELSGTETNAEPPACSAPETPKRKVLLCPAPGSADPLWAALREVKGVHWLCTCDDASPDLARKLGSPVQTTRSKGAWDEVVNEVEAVVLPVLTLELVSKLALLIADRPPVQAALAGVIQGKPVLACSSEPNRLRRASGRLPGGFLSAYHAHLRGLEALGVQLLEPPALAARLSGVFVKSTGDARSGRDVLTVADLEAAARAGTRVLQVAPGTIVTPLARDVAQQMGIEVSFS